MNRTEFAETLTAWFVYKSINKKHFSSEKLARILKTGSLMYVSSKVASSRTQDLNHFGFSGARVVIAHHLRVI